MSDDRKSYIFLKNLLKFIIIQFILIDLLLINLVVRHGQQSLLKRNNVLLLEYM